jgi:hypothetical protein
MRLKNGETFFERRDIIKKFNYSNTTFDKKSRKGMKQYPELILNPQKGIWFIHPKIVDEVYSQKRRPNRDNKNGVKSWVLDNDWMFIGCIFPRKSTFGENQERIKLLFEKLKIEFLCSDIELFFCIENNKKEEKNYSEKHTHIHFLLNIHSKIRKDNILKILEDNLKNYSDSRPFIQNYNPQYKLKGKEYTVKELINNNRKNYDYLVFKSKSKMNENI